MDRPDGRLLSHHVDLYLVSNRVLGPLQNLERDKMKRTYCALPIQAAAQGGGPDVPPGASRKCLEKGYKLAFELLREESALSRLPR